MTKQAAWGAVVLLGLTSGVINATPVGLSYLKIGAGADAVAMADAVVSTVNNPTAVYWNPGGLAFLSGFQATVVHNETIGSVRQEFAAISRRIGSFTVGIGFNGTWVDNLKAYDESANFLGSFGYYGVAMTVVGARQLTDQWGVGAGVDYLREAFDIYDASGMAFSAGFQGRNVVPHLDLGLSVRHMGSSLTYLEDPFDLPTTIQGGATYHLPLESLQAETVMAVEVRKIRDENASVLLGLEYRFQNTANLRFGYRSALDTEDLSFGLGLTRGRIQTDYAYIPFRENLGSQHRIGLTYRR